VQYTVLVSTQLLLYLKKLMVKLGRTVLFLKTVNIFKELVVFLSPTPYIFIQQERAIAPKMSEFFVGNYSCLYSDLS